MSTKREMKHDDCEAYEGLLLTVALASNKKIKAGLQYAGSGQYQNYPAGVIELGVALDALDMMLLDIISFIRNNAPESRERNRV